MQTENRYNGWTNYATWRVNLEIIDGRRVIIDARDMWPREVQDDDAYSLSKQLEEYAEEVVSGYGQVEGLAMDYARAFLSDVNWYEIAEHLLDAIRDEVAA
jgi:hypothetical protein